MNVDDANEDVGNQHDKEFQAWLEMASDADCKSNAAESICDSDYDSDEARDGFGELPMGFDTTMAVIFLVDGARHMGKCDMQGSRKSRMAVVMDVITQFILQQKSAGANLDRYSFLTFGYGSDRRVLFRDERGHPAIEKLKTMVVVPEGNSNYSAAFQAIDDLVVKGQRTRVIMLADSSANSPLSKALVCLQKTIAQHPMVDVHTIGIGHGDFSYLQQIAQIGRGTFSCAEMNVDKLVNTFTTVSVTLTKTRATDHAGERPTRNVSFELALRGYSSFDFAKRQMAFNKKTRRATRYTFHLHRNALKRNEATETHYKIRKNPFMQGGMRLIYRFIDLEMGWLPMVAKFSKYQSDAASWNYVETFVRNTVQTRVYSQRFHQAVWAAIGSPWEPRRLVSVAQCFAYRNDESWFVAEPFLKGSESGFFKWINNQGEVLIPRESCQYVMAAESFAHFTLDVSKGEHMVADIQGVARGGYGILSSLSLTDSQILSHDGSFGAADLGINAMQKFRSLHVCNNLCRKLHLAALNSIPRVPSAHGAAAGRRDKPPAQKARPEVVPPPGNIPRRGRSPERNQSTPMEKKREETVTADDLLLVAGHKARKLLFVGEYTHSFSAAAAALITSRFSSVTASQELDWWSTALNWPTAAHIKDEQNENKHSLERHGVQVMVGIDATNIELDLTGLHGAIWVMAFPQTSSDHSYNSIRAHMQQKVEGFVNSAAGMLDASMGKISVIFLAMQHLAWKLPTEMDTAHGIFIREVFWMELDMFFRHGYRPRFGDSRDTSRTATYHKHDEIVIAQWRPKRGPHDVPGGMPDQRVRSVSASRRSSSASSRR
eukprot:TRINITY_DN46749_c0_g1_i1.p1 TRINITY_DN46749_c0_g1~~TRINITY_DN46749_c0_g1_i1.p1  ORF type:complete len:830 (-),score=135.73 TRINITY_DN46749_c0_g1_i1:102-2591(-)